MKCTLIKCENDVSSIFFSFFTLMSYREHFFHRWKQKEEKKKWKTSTNLNGWMALRAMNDEVVLRLLSNYLNYQGLEAHLKWFVISSLAFCFVGSPVCLVLCVCVCASVSNSSFDSLWQYVLLLLLLLLILALVHFYSLLRLFENSSDELNYTWVDLEPQRNVQFCVSSSMCVWVSASNVASSSFSRRFLFSSLCVRSWFNWRCLDSLLCIHFLISSFPLYLVGLNSYCSLSFRFVHNLNLIFRSRRAADRNTREKWREKLKHKNRITWESQCLR